MARTASEPAGQTAGSDLMARVRAGDAAAFRELVEGHQGRVFRYCARFLGDEQLARDITQEVFLTVWKERRRYRERGRLRAYLLRIARLRSLAAAKKRRSRRHLARAIGDLPPETDRGLEASEAAQLIRRGLARVAPARAELLILRYLEELSLEEIAEVTGLRLGTVKSRLSRGLAALREELDRD